MKNSSVCLVLCVLLVICALTAGCSASMNAPKEYYGNGESFEYMDSEGLYDQYEPEEAAYSSMDADTAAGSGDVPPDQRKVIVTGTESMKTDRFDEAVASIGDLVGTSGGYVADASLHVQGNGEDAPLLRTYDAILKIPADSYQTVRGDIEALGSVVSYNEQIEDATAHYSDITGRLDTKRIEEARVLALIDRAVSEPETAIEDILTLEERLGQIRLDIESYLTQLSTIDRMASYSTLHLSLTEITAPLPVGLSANLGQKMKESFAASGRIIVTVFEALAVFFAWVVVPLGILGGMAFAGLFILKKTKRSTHK